MFNRFGRLVPRLRYVFIVVWVAAAAYFGLFAPSLSKVGSADETSFLPAQAESLSARHLIAQAFPADAAQSQAQIVFSRAGGLNPSDHSYIDGLRTWLTSDPAVKPYVDRYVTAESNPALASSYRSADGVVEIARLDLSLASFQSGSNDVVDAIRARLRTTLPAGLAAQVTGQVGIGRDYLKAIQDGTDSTTVATIILVVLILLIIYRAPLAALVPLLTIGVAFLVARGVLGFLAQGGWKLSTVLDSFIVVLVFGVGTDYTIFLISRFREELAKARFSEAISTTIGRISAVITASAATVIVGLGSMVVARFGMIQTTGPALAITVFITLLAGLTLTPALLALFGRRLFWPLHEQTRTANDESRGFWAGVGRTITTHPGLLATAVLVVLAVPLLELPNLRQSFDVLSELPQGSEARQGFDTMSVHLGKGQLLPLTVLLDVPGSDQTSPKALGAVASLSRQIAALPNVATVRSLPTPSGNGQPLRTIQASAQLGDMAAAFSAPVSTADPAAALGDQTVQNLGAASAYLAALKQAFPDLAGDARLGAAIADVGALQKGIETGRQQARVSTQLNSIADQLQLAASTGAAPQPAQLQAVGGYLQELKAAYPEVAAMPAYGDATGALARLQSGDRTAFATLVSSLKALAVPFESRPTAYLFPKSVPPSAASQQLQQQTAAARADLATKLGSLSATFASRPDDYFIPPQGASQLAPLVAVYESADRAVARFYVTTTSDPYAPEGFALVRQLRSLLDEQRGAISEAGVGANQATTDTNAQVYVGGATAEFTDIQTTMNEDFLRVAIITIIGIFLVLMLLLRSALAAIYLVATVLLSYGTSLCISAFLFQNVLGQPGMNYFIPLMVFVLLVALGSDYNIFLMSRVREEASVRGVRPGIRVASARTGTVITSAGLILAGTFGALVSSPLQLLFQVGLAVALGVLIDTFIVRSLLVPAITAFLGEWSWWPFHSAGRLAAAGVPAVAASVPNPGRGARRVAAAGAAEPERAAEHVPAPPLPPPPVPASEPEPAARQPALGPAAATPPGSPQALAEPAPPVEAAPESRRQRLRVLPRSVGPIHVAPPRRAGHLLWAVPLAVGVTWGIRRLLRR